MKNRRVFALAVALAVLACCSLLPAIAEGGSEPFTNRFGTATTICAHAGCTNTIAPSGDTNCCTVHSSRCLECGKYIDEDAMYCIDCLATAAESSQKTGGSQPFTNKFGTATTICAHAGCTNTIAPSGDTNCCTVHSSRCLECGKYIDEDAMYCIDCLATAAGSSDNSGSSSGKGSFTNAYGTSTTKCAHPGCDNPVASSGDTNCCTTHSNRCLGCGKYIDEDAMYCISCIQTALTPKEDASSSSDSQGWGSSDDWGSSQDWGGANDSYDDLSWLFGDLDY